MYNARWKFVKVHKLNPQELLNQTQQLQCPNSLESKIHLQTCHEQTVVPMAGVPHLMNSNSYYLEATGSPTN